MGNRPLVSQASPVTEKKEGKKKRKEKGNGHDTHPFMKLPKITSLSSCTLNMQYMANIPYIYKMCLKCGYMSFFSVSFCLGPKRSWAVSWRFLEKIAWIPLFISNYFLISPDFLLFLSLFICEKSILSLQLMGMLYSSSPPPRCISSVDDSNYHHCFVLLPTANQIVYYTTGLRDFVERALFVTTLFLVKVCDHFCPSQPISIYHVSSRLAHCLLNVAIDP